MDWGPITSTRDRFSGEDHHGSQDTQEGERRSTRAISEHSHDATTPIDPRSNGHKVFTPPGSNASLAGDQPSGQSAPLDVERNDNVEHQPPLTRTASTNHPFSSSPSASTTADTMQGIVAADKALPLAPGMAFEYNGLPRSTSDMSVGSINTNGSPSKKKYSPPNKFSSFFGWKSSPRPYDYDSPATVFSDRMPSPSEAPALSRLSRAPHQNGQDRLTPPALDTQRTTVTPSGYFDTPITPFQHNATATTAFVETLERELREVSSELAGSIRREMELEDELERCRIEMPTPNADPTRRTSDYFSDSGASSVKFPLVDSEAKIDELEKSRRKAEQDRAQQRAEYSQKLGEELQLRRQLEEKVQRLEEELQEKREKAMEVADKDERVRELETTLEESRRRLSQERQSRVNFEDLLTALRSELEQHRNDRDNLRDEVVPQLRSRIEGLESEAAEASTLRYENARMQNEMQTLQQERRAMTEASTPGITPISEEILEAPTSRFSKMGLTRSNSLARSPSVSNRGRGNSLSRSGSIKGSAAGREHQDPIHGAVKEVEDQRDALRKTLQNLLNRHRLQQAEHVKIIRKITAEKEQAQRAAPIRSTFVGDVTNLKEQVSTLRRRADEALEQKWQYESNIGGVKMALERAEQETRSIRDVLVSNNVPAPQQDQAQDDTFGALGISMASYASGDINIPHDPKSMIKVLRLSIAMAESERDAALREAEAYRQRARALQEEHVDREAELADQLLDSARRMEQLAGEVQAHLQANIALRERLAAAVGKGEREQSDSTAKVVQMQSRLRGLEEGVLAAQQQSERSLSAHEEDAKQLVSTSTPQVQRLKMTIPTSPNLSNNLKSPIGPLFTAKSPRIGATSSGPAESLYEATKTAELQARVRELEAALADADKEMKGVVTRIESSQYEIAELQSERDSATRQMKKLQSEIEGEKQRAQALMH